MNTVVLESFRLSSYLSKVVGFAVLALDKFSDFALKSAEIYIFFIVEITIN